MEKSCDLSKNRMTKKGNFDGLDKQARMAQKRNLMDYIIQLEWPRKEILWVRYVFIATNLKKKEIFKNDTIGIKIMLKKSFFFP